MSQPISGTIVETYLRRRGITALHGTANLRFHPRCYYRPDPDSPTETWPAMIAAVTDLGGTITGAHRTWLDPSGQDKAPIDTPRRAMGYLLGNAVWVGMAKRGMELSSPAKFTLGLLFAAIGFGLMIIPANMIVASGGALKVSALWLTVSYLFQTLGELSLSPVGLSQRPHNPEFFDILIANDSPGVRRTHPQPKGPSERWLPTAAPRPSPTTSATWASRSSS